MGKYVKNCSFQVDGVGVGVLGQRLSFHWSFFRNEAETRGKRDSVVRGRDRRENGKTERKMERETETRERNGGEEEAVLPPEAPAPVGSGSFHFCEISVSIPETLFIICAGLNG